MLSRILIILITLYQKTLSPDHGFFKALYPNGYCQFYPSCSQYAKESLQQKGIKGIFPAMIRLLKCNPWSSGGVDKVIKQN